MDSVDFHVAVSYAYTEICIVNNMKYLLYEYIVTRTRLLLSLRFAVRLLKVNDVSMRTEVYIIIALERGKWIHNVHLSNFYKVKLCFIK